MAQKIRKNIRLNGYDYSQDGWYFLTICSQNFEEIFGEIDLEGNFTPNSLGEVIENELIKTIEIRKELHLDMFQIMPNHLHLVICIGSKDKMPKWTGLPLTVGFERKFKSPEKNISAAVRGFKGKVTSFVKTDFQQLPEKIWQRGFYDRIIRNKEELVKIRKYIKDNPKNWLKDKERFKIILKRMNKN